MLRFEVTTAQVADHRQYRPSKKLSGLLPTCFCARPRFIFLRNAYLFNKPSDWFRPEHMPRVPIQSSHNIVQYDPSLDVGRIGLDSVEALGLASLDFGAIDAYAVRHGLRRSMHRIRRSDMPRYAAS
jgi:hypothetical protein